MAAPLITNPGDNLGGMYIGSPTPVDAVVCTGSTPITWSVQYGSLPPGMSLVSTTGNVLTFNGSGTVAGSYNFGIKALNADGFDVHNCYISIGEFDASYGLGDIVDAQEYALYENSLGAVGVIVAVQMDPNGWSLNEFGAYPDGLSIAGRSIYINAAQLGVGVYTVVIRATNVFGNADKTYQVTVVPAGGSGGSGYRNSFY